MLTGNETGERFVTDQGGQVAASRRTRQATEAHVSRIRDAFDGAASCVTVSVPLVLVSGAAVHRRRARARRHARTHPSAAEEKKKKLPNKQTAQTRIVVRGWPWRSSLLITAITADDGANWGKE